MSLEIVRAIGLVTIQDRGRPGRMHEALPPGGALVPELYRAANTATGNAEGAPAVEILGVLVVRALGEVALATEAGPRELHVGDELEVRAAPRRVTYLALRGGVAAPLVLGGRATQLSAGIGAKLRAGDAITAGSWPSATSSSSSPNLAPGPVRVIAGPDHEAFPADAFEKLIAAGYRVSPSSDRVGTRLEGPAIERVASYTEVSRPMVCGAIEVPRDGAPIVLGPEHPSTGGYPVIAVVAHADLGRMFAIAPGDHVRFVAR